MLFLGALINHKIKSEEDEDPSVPGQNIDMTAHPSSERHGIGWSLPVGTLCPSQRKQLPLVVELIRERLSDSVFELF